MATTNVPAPKSAPTDTERFNSTLSDLAILSEGSDEALAKPLESIEDDSSKEEKLETEPAEKKQETKKQEAKPEKTEEEELEALIQEEEPSEFDNIEEPDDSKRMASFKEFEKKHPQVLKDNKWIKDLVYHESKYKAIFPTIQDAQQASELGVVFNKFAETLGNGDITPVLGAVKQRDENAFKKLAHNFLPTLAKIDPETQIGVISTIVNNLLRQVTRAGKNNGDKNLELAAQHIAKLLYNSPNIPDKDPIPDFTADDKVSQKENELLDRQKAAFQSDVRNDGEGAVLRMIEAAIKTDDVPDLVKEALVNKIYDEIADILAKNPNHLALMNSLWSKAYAELRAGTYIQHKPRLISALLGRVKPLIPALKAKHLGGLTKNAEQTQKPEPRLNNSPPSGAARNKKFDRVTTKGKSDLEILQME